MLIHCLTTCIVSNEKYVSFYLCSSVGNFLSHDFKTFSLSWILSSLTMMYLSGVVCGVLHLFFCVRSLALHQKIWKKFGHYIFKYFFCPCFSSLGTPSHMYVGLLSGASLLIFCSFQKIIILFSLYYFQ